MMPYFHSETGILYNGDVLETLKQMPDKSANCVVTSPPYWNLRNYFQEGQLGLEKTFNEYLNKLFPILFNKLELSNLLFVFSPTYE